jgi:hypothetical protein
MGMLDAVFGGISRWPVLQQIRKGDLQAKGETARSPRSAALAPRTEAADRVVRSICPYCAVGCGQLVYVEDGRISDIEGVFGIAGKLADLVAMQAVERAAERVERVGRPLRAGISGALWQAARALTAASLALTLLPGRSRAKRLAGGLLGTAGALALRFGIFHAGKASARDPKATLHSQRSAREPRRGDVTA